MYQARQNRAFHVLKVVLFLLLVLIVSLGGTFILYKGLRIQNILIEGEKVAFGIDESRITRNLLFFPSEKVRLELLRSSPLLKDIQIQKIYPSTLKFIVTKRTGVARLMTKDQQYILDNEAYIIGTPGAVSNALPPLYFDVPVLPLGSIVHNDGVIRSLQILRLFPKEYAIVRIVEVEKQSIRVDIQESDILFPQDGDIVEHMHTLQTLFTGFRIKGALPSHIDLRFGKPIVR